jgi:hypothetical protein
MKLALNLVGTFQLNKERIPSDKLKKTEKTDEK